MYHLSALVENRFTRGNESISLLTKGSDNLKITTLFDHGCELLETKGSRSTASEGVASVQAISGSIENARVILEKE